MPRSLSPRPLLLALAVLAAIATPLAAQQSPNSAFFKGLRARDAAAVEALVSNPSSGVINARDPATGEGALHVLTRGRDRDWLAYMLARGARADMQEAGGTTALQIAAQIGWIEGVELLLSRGASVDRPNSRGETPLILAVQNRQLAVVRTLLNRGADPNRTDNIAGYSALDYARRDREQLMTQTIENALRNRPSNVAGPTLN